MRMLIAALLLAGLAGCAKKAPPQPPGPTDQIIYPKSYPTK